MAGKKDKQWEQPKLNGYELQDVLSVFDYFRSFRAPKERIWALINKFYNGDFWKDLKAKLPNHQIMPDTNYLYYITQSIVNSVYSGNYVANVLPRHYKDNGDALMLNSFIEYTWDKLSMKKMFPKLGKYTILSNYAGIQVGWNPKAIGGSEHIREAGSVVTKFIPSEQLFMDPTIADYKQGRALFISRRMSLFDALTDPMLKHGAKAYKDHLDNEKGGAAPGTMSDSPENIHGEQDNSSQYSKNIQLLECFYKVVSGDGYRIDHVFIADRNFILFVKEDIKPKKFPIRVLYGESPDTDPYNNPISKVVLANIVAINMLDSIEATHAYASQNRAKLVSITSGINYRSFTKYGNTPHMAFPVKGDPNNVVKYVDVQALPSLIELRGRLENAIFIMTGVDLRYTGRDTGSIQTTGGTDLAQQRVMAMTDNARILSLEVFIEDLTSLILDYYIEFGDKYVPVTREAGTGKAQELDKDADGNEKVLNFKNIPANKFDYTMNAAPYLPKNSMRLDDAADRLMEMQGQYNFDPPLITHEEWVMWKQIPQKELILQRMRAMKMQLDTEELTAELLSFAGMVEQGLDPKDAIETLVQERQLKRDNPGMSNAPSPTQQTQL